MKYLMDSCHFLVLATALLLFGCGIDSDPILSNPDETQPTPTKYQGCDIDLTCTADCADDLDCGALNTPSAPLGVDRMEELPAITDESISIEAGGEKWWSMENIEAGETIRVEAQAADGLVLVAYDAAGVMLARSVDTTALEFTAESTLDRVMLRLVATSDDVSTQLDMTRN